jgi:hypothetical protein
MIGRYRTARARIYCVDCDVEIAADAWTSHNATASHRQAIRADGPRLQAEPKRWDPEAGVAKALRRYYEGEA